MSLISFYTLSQAVMAVVAVGEKVKLARLELKCTNKLIAWICTVKTDTFSPPLYDKIRNTLSSAVDNILMRICATFVLLYLLSIKSTSFSFLS